MQIVEHFFCDYCGKSKPKDEMVYKTFTTFLTNDMTYKFRDEIKINFKYEDSGCHLCNDCVNEMTNEMLEVYNKHYLLLRHQFFKNQKMKEILLAGFEAQIQNYLKENDNDN